MIKLLMRVPYNAFYALDLLLSALTFGAKGETISARLWASSLPTAPLYQRLPAKAARIALDAIVYLVFGEAAHTLTAYNNYIATLPKAS